MSRSQPKGLNEMDNTEFAIAFAHRLLDNGYSPADARRYACAKIKLVDVEAVHRAIPVDA